MKSFRPRPSQAQGSGKSDLLLRLFDSQFFDAWLALTYIYQNETGGVHDYLCNKLYDLSEHKIELYLSQFSQLIVTRPGSSLQRVIVDLCSKSLRIAVKVAVFENARKLEGCMFVQVYWLFRAITQDQPKNKHAAELLDQCEREALNGCWELPFKSPMLDPPTLSVECKEDSAFMQKPHDLPEPSEFLSAAEAVDQPLIEELRAESPVGGGSASICSSHDIVQGLEGLFSASVSRTYSGSQGGDVDHADLVSNDTERSSATFERCRILRQELGEGEGVSALLARSSRNEAAGGTGCVAACENEDWAPSSPGLRQTTFGATLDFIDALCDASSHLVHLPQDTRLKALKRALMDINAEIDLCNANGVAVWFPMGSKNQRVLRLVPDEAVLLNSREKAPFLLLIEVMDTDAAEDSPGPDATHPTQPYADSVDSVNRKRGSSSLETATGETIQEAESSNADSDPVPISNCIDEGLENMDTTNNTFTARMETAMAGLRGNAPLVKVRFEVNEEKRVESGNGTESQAPGALDGEASESAASSLMKEGAVSLMVSKLLQCSTNCINIGMGEEWFRSQQVKEQKLVSISLEIAGGVNLKIPSPSKKNRRVPSQEALEIVAGKMKLESLHKSSQSDRSGASDGRTTSEASMSQDFSQDERFLRLLKKQKRASDVYGERWVEKEAAVQRRSPHGHRPGWNLCRVVVKSGDDCRQELMAIQLIKTFQDIFLDARLPLWVAPYEVLVTSNRTALIEFIPDTLSVHSIKHRSASGTTLSQHFFDKFIRGTPECAVAQRNFVESLAAYSLITYLLQLKDRHNGNILMDDEGHVIHIDFGFMLSNSPGGVNFEAAPFKLTREYLEIMDSNSEGKASELFDYFKVLCIQGFLISRKYSERILLLCDMMSKAGFPCFKAGDRATKALKKRFHLNIPEEQCVQVVIGAISDSLDAWRTRQYDYYQRVLNGIL